MSFYEYEDCFVWSCDRCGKSAEFPPNDFWSALAELKSRGWRVERGREGWAHTCPGCRKGEAARLLDRVPKIVKN
jgi:hypothetical protein